MPLGPRVWGVGKVLLLAGALVATYLVFAAIAMRVAIRAREIRVPTLIGRHVDEAAAMATTLGLTLNIDETRRPDPKVPAGHVLGQEPAPGASARRQRGIRVWISAGAREVLVPRLIGESERSAQIRLTQESLSVGMLAEIRDAEYPPGVVVAQDPPAESKATAVSLLINRGEDRVTYVMPDLIGVNGDRAADVLRSNGFRIAVVGEHPYPGVPAGIVLRQHPQPGFEISRGETISLEVSK